MTDSLPKVHEVHGFIREDDEHDIAYRHERHVVGSCPWCDFIRRENIVKEFMRRIEVCERRIKALNMWSLGSSLTNTTYNRKVLLQWWRIFSRRMVRVSSWNPVFRVVEVGRRGFLHIHVLCTDYVDHSKVLRTWRSITGEASNVHVSGSRKGAEIETIVRYLVKYLSKEGSAYRWLGVLYGLGDRSRRITTGGRPGYRYGGVTCYTWTSRGYSGEGGAQRNLDKD